MKFGKAHFKVESQTFTLDNEKLFELKPSRREQLESLENFNHGGRDSLVYLSELPKMYPREPQRKTVQSFVRRNTAYFVHLLKKGKCCAAAFGYFIYEGV